MRKYILLSLLLSLSTSNLFANNYLWEIHSKKATVYLLGSIHLAKPEIYPLSSAINEAYESSNKLVVEVNVNNVDQTDLSLKMLLKGGKTLKSVLNDSTYLMYKQELDKIGLHESMYSKMKPWAAMMIIIQQKLAAAGYLAEAGIDQHYLNRAETDKKTVLELESMDIQIDMLEKFDDLGSEYFHYSINELSNSLEQFEDIFVAWKAGDTTKISEVAFADTTNFKGMQNLMDNLLDKRNIGMAEKIDGYLKTDKVYFVIVGSAHMVGNNGLLRLLENKGYKLKQL